MSALKEIGFEKSYVVHYSCAELVANRKSICAIVLQPLSGDESITFSIAGAGSSKKLNFSEMEEKYEELEREILSSFFDFLRKLEVDKTTLLHWNMQSSSYGFSAIEDRANSLGIIKENTDFWRDFTRVDVAAEFYKELGADYAEHPRMWNLFKYNKLDHPDILLGFDEALAIRNRDYKKVELSTQQKSRKIRDLVDIYTSGKLKYRKFGLIELLKGEYRTLGWFAIFNLILNIIALSFSVMSWCSGL